MAPTGVPGRKYADRLGTLHQAWAHGDNDSNQSEEVFPEDKVMAAFVEESVSLIIIIITNMH